MKNIFVTLLLFCNTVAQLKASTLDLSFDVGTGANNTVTSIVVQPDGKILIGGGFTQYNGTNINRLARLNSDGSLDASFDVGTGANSSVVAIIILADGKILIAGYFTQYNGVTLNRIARLNADGSIDNTFTPGTAANNPIRCFAIQSDGKILIAGGFTTYNGTAINRVARLNADGSFDNTFNPGTGANGFIRCIAIQSDGKIIIGGDFTDFNGTAIISGAVRLNTDGSLDTTFDAAVDTNYISAVAIQSDGKILLGCAYNAFDGSTKHIYRLNSDGTFDITFDVGTGTLDAVWSIIPLSDGKILIGGYFGMFNGSSVKHIVRLNANGSLDATYGVSAGANNEIYTIALYGGKILIGGYFVSYNSISRNRLARIVGSTSTPTYYSATNCGNYLWYGNTYTTSGVYSITNAYGTEVLSLTINSIHNVETQVACDNYIWKGTNYTVDGTYIYTYTNNGCVSADTLHLTINNAITPTITTNNDVDLISSVNSGNQWFFNASAITGATSQNYTATQNGTYTLQVTDINGCTQISLPTLIETVGIDEFKNFEENLNVFPNPTNSKIQINHKNEFDEIKILNLLGEEIYSEKTISSKPVEFDTSKIPSGTYIVKVGKEVKRFIKQ